MAIVGVRTELKQNNVATRPGSNKTGIAWWMNTGTVKGQSNKVGTGSYNTYLGKALNFIGNPAATREIPISRTNY